MLPCMMAWATRQAAALAFWCVDAAYASPDVEILNAVEPGLATTGGPLILASSPHARRGVLWEMFRRHHDAGGDPLILVAYGASRTLNPSLPQRVTRVWRSGSAHTISSGALP